MFVAKLKSVMEIHWLDEMVVLQNPVDKYDRKNSKAEEKQKQMSKC